MAILPYKSVVTVPAASKDMTILATVKTELKISGTADDAFLSVLIQQASSKAAELCGREFAKETLVDTLRADASDDTLQLSRWPIVTVTSVVEDGVTITTADYEIVAANGWLLRVNSSGDPKSWAMDAKVVVTYEAGWVLLTNLPHALERIVIDEIKRRWFGRERSSLLRSEEVPGVVSLSHNDEDHPMRAELAAAGFIVPLV